MRSQHTAKKSLNMISAMGRRPFIAAPMIIPMMACSEIGVSRTRTVAEPLLQSDRGLEHAARGADVLADEVDGRVAFHLLRDPAADCLPQRQFRHDEPPSA